jgi:spore photoproduct lyase
MYEKLKSFLKDPLWHAADSVFKTFFEKAAAELRLTVQQIRTCLVIQSDFDMWGAPGIRQLWEKTISEIKADNKQAETGKEKAARAMRLLETTWNQLKNNLTEYPEQEKLVSVPSVKQINKRRNSIILGDCPVASPRTRCCNLKTLDAALNCGFGCSYCSIQTFNTRNTVFFDPDLKQKLEDLKLDPAERYHIGTGQSSDSLMWGNRNGMLDHLFDFARTNPNVILELKTKSKNISYLLKNDIPQNVIVSWSLNTPTVIRNEEHGTASLDERLEAAAAIAAKGALVGFHFHPIIMYQGWAKDYTGIAARLLRDFKPGQICMVSLGTLTFIKPVIKALRAERLHSKVLQIPLEETEGKFSYRFDEKLEMFTTLYRALEPWHADVFFYLCMEDPALWEPVFGFEYIDNNEFELAMLDYYFSRIIIKDK